MADEMNDRSSSLVQALFTPRGVALIGASGDPTKNSGRPQRFLKSHGFTGAVYPINPGRDEVQGVPAFKSVADVPGPVDHAFVMVPAQHVEDAIRQCGEKGVPVATIYSDGFAETGEDGRKMQERLVATARKAGVRLIGPNSMAMALQRYPHMAGTASSLMGVMQFGIGALFGAVVGQTFDGTIAPMTTAMGIAGVLCLISHRLLVRRG